jgi:hypothetical protein
MSARFARLTAAAAAAVVALTAGVSAALPPSGTARTAPSDAHIRRAALTPTVARALGPSGELRSMSLNDVGVGARGLTATIADFPRMASDGITSVTAYVYLYVQSPTSNEVSPGVYTASDAELEAVADAAHASGMDIHIMPVLLDLATNGWRGRYLPSDPAAFFASYDGQLSHYAQIAQRVGATMFYVGSENDRFVNLGPYWRDAVKVVRQSYSGAVSYMATPMSALRVSFWSSLDLASISPYFALSDEDNPTYQRFVDAWRTVHLPRVRRLAARIGKPLIFGEIGYNAQQHAFAEPAANPPPTKLPAPAAQADAYAALLDVLKDTPFVYGVGWWRWQSGTTPADTSYSPAGKPAECVIASHWSQNASVRSAAAGPYCDLHRFDQALATAGTAIPKL